MKQIKIVLIDDHELFRSGLKSILQKQEDFEVIGEASDGLAGVKMIAQLQPDMVLLDLDMPVMHGKEALAQIISEHPELAVLMLTVSEDGADLADCMRMGARGYLLKNINVEFLLTAIRRAVDGDSVSPRDDHQVGCAFALTRVAYVPQRNRQPHAARAWKPSNGWQQVCRTNTSRHMNVAESTIKVHVQSILRKLNLISRVQAAGVCGKTWVG